MFESDDVQESNLVHLTTKLRSGHVQLSACMWFTDYRSDLEVIEHMDNGLAAQ